MYPRAWQVQRLGPPEDALRLVAAEPREPGPGEATVAVEAVGLNFPDLLLCAGRYQERPPLPFSPGYEAAGRILATGPGCERLAGERVIVVPELPNGAFQERITVSDAELYPVPDEIAPVTAAVLHIAYQTAHVALHRRAGLRAGETVLVHGAAGGVGAAAVQLAKAAGARVIATATGARRAEAARRLGADQAIDLAATPDFAAEVGAADVILDVVGGDVFDRSRRCVAFGGRIVVAGFAGGAIPHIPANHVLLRNYSVVGLHLAAYRREEPELLRAVHLELLELLRDGRVDPPIDSVLPFERAPEGLRRLAERRAIGRVVLRCADGAPRCPGERPAG